MTSEQSRHLYLQLLRVRTFEDRVGELFLKGGSAGTMLHLSIGEEAPAVGVAEAMQPKDSFTTHHRGHGIFLARGADPKRMLAEIAGKEAGYCRGKGGSMHIADRQLGHLGANAIVGGGIPHVVGAGLSYQLLKVPAVSIAFFGDGAMQQGNLYESMNLAALWKLPVLFVCINNQYGMGTRLDQASASLEFVKRSESFGLIGKEVSGLDVEEVKEEAMEILEMVREGKPAFMKIDCYRFHGHARKDKSPYRDQNEEEEGRKKDPIKFQADRLIEQGVSISEMDIWHKEVADEMDEALNFALETQEPALNSMFEDVYAPNLPHPESVGSRIDRALYSEILEGDYR